MVCPRPVFVCPRFCGGHAFGYGSRVCLGVGVHHRARLPRIRDQHYFQPRNSDVYRAVHCAQIIALSVKSRLIVYTFFEEFRVLFLPLLEHLNGRQVTNRLLWNGVIVDADVMLDSGLEFDR